MAGVFSMMSKDNKDEREQSLVKAAYEIGGYIREVSKTYIPNPLCPDFFQGPHALDWETERGLVLTILYHIEDFCPHKEIVVSVYIETPYGAWKVLDWPKGISDQAWQQLFIALKDLLGLEVLPEEKTRFGRGGASYAITHWKKRSIEKPMYRKPPPL
jgi:hypothetical protein